MRHDQRTPHRIVAAGICGLLLLGFTACTDDDDVPATTGTTLEPIGDGQSRPASEDEGETSGVEADSGSGASSGG